MLRSGSQLVLYFSWVLQQVLFFKISVGIGSSPVWTSLVPQPVIMVGSGSSSPVKLANPSLRILVGNGSSRVWNCLDPSLPTNLSLGSSRHPAAKWAQRSDKVYLTIELPDAKEVNLKLEPEGKFAFSATKDGVPYEMDINFFDRVNVEESKANVGVRSIVYVIKKAEKKWWSRLLKQEGKPPALLKVDWDRWVDEEDENEKKVLDLDNMDFSKLDMGGDDDLDMDDYNDAEEEVKAKEEENKKEA